MWMYRVWGVGSPKIGGYFCGSLSCVHLIWEMAIQVHCGGSAGFKVFRVFRGYVKSRDYIGFV